MTIRRKIEARQFPAVKMGCKALVPRAFVKQLIADALTGKTVVVDVQGAKQVKSKMQDAIAIFILPPSFAELERRLKARMLEPDDVIRRRLEIAKGEIQFYREYDYIVINDIPKVRNLHKEFPQLYVGKVI